MRQLYYTIKSNKNGSGSGNVELRRATLSRVIPRARRVLRTISSGEQGSRLRFLNVIQLRRARLSCVSRNATATRTSSGLLC
eukprot:4100097-Pleurochrysis_carterae.AAC.1